MVELFHSLAKTIDGRIPLRLYLVQHGEAKSKSEDPERPLTGPGAAAVKAMAAWAARAGVDVREIRHSGKLRAQETAALFARDLKPANGVFAVDGLDPNDDVGPVVSNLATETAPIMIVGHLPFLSRLVGRLTTGDPEASVIGFRNGGIVCLVQEDEIWRIEWVVPPSLI